MRDDIINKAIEVYIDKLENENTMAKHAFSDISNVLAFDGSEPNRTDEDRYHDILDILR
jgi:hypothetical protein